MIIYRARSSNPDASMGSRKWWSQERFYSELDKAIDFLERCYDVGYIDEIDTSIDSECQVVKNTKISRKKQV